jgi:hypothetical protein
VVERGHHREAATARDAAEGLHHQAAVREIETRHRLVGEHHARILREQPGDRDALLLTARERVGTLPHALDEPHVVEAPQRALALLGTEGTHQCGDPPPSREMRQPPDQHVVEHAQASDEIELLVDHADPRAVGAQRAPLERRQIVRSDADVSLGHERRAREAAEQRRLSRSGPADHGDELTRRNRGGDTVERGHRFPGETLGDLIDRDERGCRETRHAAHTTHHRLRLRVITLKTRQHARGMPLTET